MSLFLPRITIPTRGEERRGGGGCVGGEKVPAAGGGLPPARVQYRFHHHRHLQGKSVHKILWDSFFAVLIAMLLSGLWVVSCGA